MQSTTMLMDDRGGIPQNDAQRDYARGVAQKLYDRETATGPLHGILGAMVSMRPYAQEQSEIMATLLVEMLDNDVYLNTDDFRDNTQSMLCETDDIYEIRRRMAYNCLIAHGDIACVTDEDGDTMTGITLATLHELDRLADGGLYPYRRPPTLWLRETTDMLRPTPRLLESWETPPTAGPVPPKAG